MNRWAVVLLLTMSLGARAQTKPIGACPFAGFESDPSHQPILAEVATRAPAVSWMACDSPKGCVSLKVEPRSPVQVYRSEGEWTCGYAEDRHGAGPAWFRSKDLRPVTFALNPPAAAWYGVWVGGEDRVVISPGTNGQAVRLVGHGIWHGARGNDHFGSTRGEARPSGNRLHFVDEGCTIELTLAGRFILASDNQGCGGMNVRFAGFWRRR